MARKGDRYNHIPTLWHIGIGNPCRVMRKRKGQKRWQNRQYSVLTQASAGRFLKLRDAGKVQIRRDVELEAWLSFGITSLAETRRAILEGKQKMMVERSAVSCGC